MKYGEYVNVGNTRHVVMPPVEDVDVLDLTIIYDNVAMTLVKQYGYATLSQKNNLIDFFDYKNVEVINESDL
jgi:hypothetical protein